MSVFFRAAERRDGDDGWVPMSGRRRLRVDEAKYLPPVFASIRAIVDYAATVPVEFYRKNPDGSRQIVPAPVLIQNVDAEYGWQTWIGQAAYGIVTRGNAVGVVKQAGAYGVDDKPTLVEWAHDWTATRDLSFAANWFVNGLGTAPQLVAHIPWIVPGGQRLGLSPIEHYAAIAEAGMSAQEYADVKRGGGIPPAILKNNAQKLEPGPAAQVQSRAVASFSSGKPFVSGKDWDLTIVSVPPAQASFIQTMKLTAQQIAAIYGLDPREIGGDAVGGSITYANDESRALNRAHDMRPYLDRLEHGISRMLPAQTFMRYKIEDTIRADTKTQSDIEGSQISDGRLSVNEARAKRNLSPVKGGDFHNVPAPTSAPTISKPIAPAPTGNGEEQ